MCEIFWVILDASENEQPFCDPIILPDGVDQRIPPKKRSAMVYGYKENAEEELIRLASENPNGEFYLLEATDFALKIGDGNYTIRSTIKKA